MRLTWKDAGATLLVGVAVALYAAYLAGADLPLVAGPRVLAVVVLGLGLAACITSAELPTATADRRVDRNTTRFALLGAAAFVAALITMIWASEVSLGALVAILVLMWLISTVRHALGRRTRYRVTDADLRRLTTPEQPQPQARTAAHPVTNTGTGEDG